MIEWENGEITSQPLEIIFDISKTFSLRYLKNNILIKTNKKINNLINRSKNMSRILNQAIFFLKNYSSSML